MRQDPLGLAGEADVVVPDAGTRPGMESQRHEIGTTSLPSTTPSSVESGGYAEDGRFTPYFDRGQIEDGALAGKEQEILEV